MIIKNWAFLIRGEDLLFSGVREAVSAKWERVGSGSAGMFVKVLRDLVSGRVCVQKFRIRKSPKYYHPKRHLYRCNAPSCGITYDSHSGYSRGDI
jgi:hypothetical protein